MFPGNVDDGRAWIESLMPKIKSKLGKGFEDVEYELSVPSESFYISNLFYVNIRAKGNTGENEKSNVSIVVKRPPQIEFLREMMGADAQFHNEILFYRDYAKESDNFPRPVYLEKNPSNSVIALENVKERGYDICPYKYDPPTEYTLSAMREIGRFHGKGYVMKERQREEFFDIVGDTQDHRFGTPRNEQFMLFLNAIGPWPAEYLRDRGYDKDFCDKAHTLLSHSFEKIMLKIVEPVEPLSTLCHGDFTLNNILFKKTEDNIKPMLIDFALLRYGTPIIDLSTFICLYSPNELKKDRLEIVLKAYHDALTEYLVENDIEDLERYSYEAVYDDFKRGCMFGFILATFFLTTVLGKSVFDPSRFDMSQEALAELCREQGGDEVAKILADMLLDLKDIGCLDHLL